MKCKCGYEGWAEMGNFGFNKEKLRIDHYRCPKCKSSTDVIYIDPIDSVRQFLMFGGFCNRSESLPHKAKKKIDFITGGADNNLVGYSIYCPICIWGVGSAIEREDYEKLIKEAEEGKFILVEKDCETELRGFNYENS